MGFDRQQLAKHFQKLCNFKAELLCCEVHEAELRFVKQSSPKQALIRHLNHKTPDKKTIYHQTPIAKYKMDIYLDLTESLEARDSGVLGSTVFRPSIIWLMLPLATAVATHHSPDGALEK
jgi:hypothetical protein